MGDAAAAQQSMTSRINQGEFPTMSGLVRNLAALGGVVVLAIGGTTAYFLSQHPTSFSSHPADVETAPSPIPPANHESVPAPAAPADLDAEQPPPSAPAPRQDAATAPPLASTTPATPDPGASTAEPPKSAEPEPDVWPQGVKPVKFVSSRQAFTLLRDSAAYIAPSETAPQMYPLPAGRPVYTVEKSADGEWIVAMTTDGKAAYLPTRDLGPFDPSRPAPPILQPSITGTARVMDTANLVVGGQTVSLSGVLGEGGSLAQNLQKLINSRGPAVTCSLRGEAYQCRLPDGLDIARAALFNGAAKPAEDASEDYRAQAEAAEAAHRGIWRE